MSGRVVVLGSVNADTLLTVPRIVAPGETLAATNQEVRAGGKGLNQAVAAARAGAAVAFHGRIGADGGWLRDVLAAAAADVAGLVVDEAVATGHAVVQIAADGENAIVILAGANRGLPRSILDAAVADVGADDWLLLQNETDWTPEAIAAVAEGPGRVALNLAPADVAARDWPLERLDLLVVNQSEAALLTGASDLDAQLAALTSRVAGGYVAVTLGAEGATLAAGVDHPSAGERASVAATPVDVVDTTGAGDTFTGYLVAGLAAGLAPDRALARAAVAGALSCTRTGAAASIPDASAVDAVA